MPPHAGVYAPWSAPRWISCHSSVLYPSWRNKKTWEIIKYRRNAMTKKMDATLELGYTFPMRIDQVEVHYGQ